MKESDVMELNINTLQATIKGIILKEKKWAECPVCEHKGRISDMNENKLANGLIHNCNSCKSVSIITINIP